MYYVYTYKDPAIDEVIYVGKGQAYRYKSHLNKSHNTLLEERIQQIRSHGNEPVVEKVFESDNEDQVLLHEESLILEYKLVSEGGSLCNLLKTTSSNTQVFLKDQHIELLGKYPDRVVGEMTGVNWSTLRDKRVSLGIPSFKETHKGTSNYSSYFLKDSDVITLFDSNGNTFTGDRRRLCEELSIDNCELGAVIKGVKSHIKGYSVENLAGKVNPYTRFLYESGNKTYAGTYTSFAETFNLLKRSVRNGCIRGRFEDWIITRIEENKAYTYD